MHRLDRSINHTTLRARTEDDKLLNKSTLFDPFRPFSTLIDTYRRLSSYTNTGPCLEVRKLTELTETTGRELCGNRQLGKPGKNDRIRLVEGRHKWETSGRGDLISEIRDGIYDGSSGTI